MGICDEPDYERGALVIHVPDEQRLKSESERRSRLAATWVPIVIAGCALALSGYGIYSTYKHQKLSAKPLVGVEFSSFDKGFTLSVFNSGLGPALIHSVKLSVEGKPIRNEDDLISVFKKRIASEGSGVHSTMTHPVQHNWLRAGEKFGVITLEWDLPPGAKTSQPEGAVLHAMQDFTMTVCFSSLYEEHEEVAVDSILRSPSAHKGCTYSDAPEFFPGPFPHSMAQ